jgi:hypothetical protein
MALPIPIDPATFRRYYPTVDQATVKTAGKTSYVVTLKDPAMSVGRDLNRWATDLKNDNPNWTKPLRGREPGRREDPARRRERFGRWLSVWP